MIARIRNRSCQFAHGEDGALLVFFAMCCAAIFLIAALSFDLGKRASTQSELQSFADSVALAAAAELDGMPGAIDRAQTAADQLIRDTVTFGEGSLILSGASDYTISFFADLPTNEAAWNAALDVSLAENDLIARFARIEVNPVRVDWSFARILGVFSTAPLPDDTVRAEATGGFTAQACDVTSVFFCMPPAESGVDLDGIWDPANHIGDAIKLDAASGGPSNWQPGSMGFIDASGATDIASPCYGETGISLNNCLLNVVTRRTQCLENGALAFRNGHVFGVSDLFFNTRMDMYRASYTDLQNDPYFPNAPVVTKGYDASSTCGPGAATEVADATGFLPDDDMSLCANDRCGDGDWSDARLEYVDRNYSVDPTTIGTAEPVERITVLGNEYHIDDPFRPGDATNPRKVEYVDFPVILAGASRWNYYNAEVASVYFEEPAAAYLGNTVDLTGASSALRATPIDLLVDMLAEDGSVIPRLGSSLPQCAPDNTSLDPRRRAFIAAAVDCDTAPINGPPTGRATWFVELFVLDAAEGPGSEELYFDVEVISPGLQNSGRSHTNGTFRNHVQLYR